MKEKKGIKMIIFLLFIAGLIMVVFGTTLWVIIPGMVIGTITGFSMGWWIGD